LLAGIITSLPEIITLITLLKLKNYNAGYSNMIGSTFCNALTIAISDLCFRGDLYVDNINVKYLTIFTLISIACVGGCLFIRKMFFNVKKRNILSISFLSVLFIIPTGLYTFYAINSIFN
jgi:cation:H+ antiporter